MGTYRYARMPFGLHNAPAMFQRALGIILSGARWQSCIMYMDDVIIFFQTHDEPLSHLHEVLTLLSTTGVKLKPQKCFFIKVLLNTTATASTPATLACTTTPKAPKPSATQQSLKVSYK